MGARPPSRLCMDFSALDFSTGPMFDALTIDTHLDTPTTSLLRAGWDFGVRHDRGEDGSQCDLPRMCSGGLDAAVFAMYVMQGARTPAGFAAAREVVAGYLERTTAEIARLATACTLARSVDEALLAKAAGRRSIFLSIENAYPLGLDPGAVGGLHRQGVRMVGLTHMLNNDVADSSTDPRGPEWGGLSGFGREVVAECNRLGLVLDASHASDDTLRHLLTQSRTPVLLSHSDCRALCDHPRNVDDGLLRELAAQGGVIQMNALPISLVDAPGNRRTAAIADVLVRFAEQPLTAEVMTAADAAYSVVSRANPNPPATLEDFIRHLEHAVEVAGIDHVGIGCDFDGGGGVDGLRDVADFPNLTLALRARGWTESDLARVWGGNTLRVFRAAEAAAVS